ncbi:HNWD1 [Coprinopsis cinerea okayama7|uniref:HNWD1 n=1 Tax=Coprinopsis cinerea (strain Okayama-7 / 130 / ATCC MYA-4618 / FGSC 9003) TaxID=240176 RepID=A8PG40_COPC7|nr:HNWD1 [Coprinopsis cinerea okayama7\|eukprot:XP_001841141.2 HNWD1 [Coprinopsis cinerea okayama7\
MSTMEREDRPAVSAPDERKSPSFLQSPPFSFFRSGSSPRVKSRTLSSDGSVYAEQAELSPSPSASGSPTPSVQAVRLKDGKDKFFPRSTTLPSITFSDSSTLLNPSSPPLKLHHLDDEKIRYGTFVKPVTAEPEGRSPLRSVQISGITVLLSTASKQPVSVRLFKNGSEFLKLPFVRGDSADPLRWNLKPHLTIRGDTNISLQVRKRRRWPKNPVLVEVPVSYDEVADVIPAFHDDITTYQLIIHEDPLIIVDVVADVEPLQANLQNAHDKAREIRSALDHLGKSRHFLEHLVHYGAAFSEHLEQSERCDRIVVGLAESMARTLGYIEDVEQFARLAQLKRALEDIRPLMEDTTNFILKYTNRSRTDKAFKTSFFRDEVDILKKRYDRFQEQFDRGLAVQSTVGIEDLLQRLASNEDDQILQDLKPRGLEFTSYPFSECMKGTRLSVLSAIDEWVHDLEASNVLWIRGFPGAGKTAIASTIVNQLRDLNRLGARFVFQRDQETVSTANALWRSVAYDLARLYPSVRRIIVERIREEDVDVETSNVRVLFRELIEEPLRECRDIPSGRLPVIVIDALDECGGRDGRRSIHRATLLQTLKRWPQLPTHFKLILTSRIEDDITKVLTPFSEIIDLSTGVTVKKKASDDIRHYLTYRFSKIAEDYDSLPSDWPGPVAIEDLTTRAAGLFLWAKTAVEFVNLGEPTSQLQLLLEGNGTLGDVDDLYSRVLEMSFRNPTPEVVQAFQDLVGVMIFAKRPLSEQDCIHLLPYSASMVEFIRKGLRSVLDDGNLLRFQHESFPEFLLNSETCPEEFRIREGPHHRNLAIVSLRLMLQELRFNICHFPSSHKRNDAVPDLPARAAHFITPALNYASCFWMDHVQMVPFDEEILDLVRQLLHEKLLYWFEVLSIIEEMYSASTMLDMLLDWVQPSEDQALIAFIEDAIKYLGSFAGVMAQSAPHIYISTLPFAPSNSLVARQYLPYFPRTIRITRGRCVDWPRIVFSVDEHDDAVNSVAFSRDGKLIVSASNDKTVRVWDAETGDPKSGPLEGHEGYVTTAVFSPDGRLVVSGSDDYTIRVWDADSGEEVAGPLSGHRNVISSIAFCPKGIYIASASYDNTIHLRLATDPQHGPVKILEHPAPVNTLAFSSHGARLASGSSDRIVRVWDVASGEVLNRFEGHTNSINCVVFSPDETTIASASEDETIRLWDLVTNSPIGAPLEGHTDAVTSIAFSQDGRRLISGAYDGILLLWEVSTGAIVGQFTGHWNGVTSVAFSPDGKRVLSGSCDETIAVWDAEVATESDGSEKEDSEYSLTPFLDIPAHQDNVKSISFSPDGRYIASGSDDETLRVWDAETGIQLPIGFHRDDLDGHHWYRFPLPPTHKHAVEVVSYSPDGQLMATGGGYNDETLCIWNSETGKLHIPVLRGHAGGITSLVWFPDSTRLASSSYDATVRIWNIGTGETVAGPYAPHTSWVTSLAITADGTRLASASRDHSIQVMDAETLEPVGEPLLGHGGSVNCVIFSPDGRFLASASNDRTIRLWNPESGEVVWVLKEAHRKSILCLSISRDGQYLASASVDKSINLWNVESGTLHLGPLEGHTGTIFSVAFNNDGTRLASSAEDETIRVWDVSSSDIQSDLADARPAEFADDSGYQNGWIVRSRNNYVDCLILWVPPWCRSEVWWPRNTAVIAEDPVKLDLTYFCHGTEWHRCVEPIDDWA